MKAIKHTSALSTHYDQEAANYDVFNESNSLKINQLIEKILDESDAQTVLDLTCGTGSQVFWFHDKGFKVFGMDINEKMLSIAKDKAKQRNANISFEKGDIRSSKVGQFDAVITIFNSIGHLTQDDFEKALINIGDNLKSGGLYIFDIFNLDYLLYKDNITKLTIDWLKTKGDIQIREIQYSTIAVDGILTSYDIYHEQRANKEPKISTAYQTLQVYNAHKLQSLLINHGFEIQKQIDVNGSMFKENDSERILTIARKSH